MRTTGSLSSADERACLRTLLSKQLIPLAMLLVLFWIIYHKAATLDFTSIFASVAAIAPHQWALAILGAALSFLAIGRMDAVIHRLIGSEALPLLAQLSGIASVATAQLTGFGLLTGTLARWRILSDTSLLTAAQITGAVSISFMVSLGLITAVMVLLVGPSFPMARPIAAAAILAISAMVLGSLWRPRVLMRLKLPPIRAQVRLIGLALADTGAAAFTLYVFIHEAYIPSLPFFFTVFLLALGAGLLGTTPGGIGPFEVVFLACLPKIPQAQMLAAIMGYCLVYFALPATLAVILLIAGPALARFCTPQRESRQQLKGVSQAEQPPLALSALCHTANRAEFGLLRQGEFDLLIDDSDQATSLVAPAAQSLIMLADPLEKKRCATEAIYSLEKTAIRRFLTPCIYKYGARTAVSARKLGWRILRVAQEAWITPSEFDLACRSRRQLCRQLRKADCGGITISEAVAPLPIAQMYDIAQRWSAHHGGARGFSVCQFDNQYVSTQRVYLAHVGPYLMGFISLHEAWHERTLDLMCQRPDAPPGTMHALV